MDFFNYTKGLHNDISYITAQIKKEYEKEVFEIDAISIRKRFKTEYTSFFKYFKTNYRSDKKLIISLKNTSEKSNNDETIINLLDNLKLLQEKKEIIFANKEKLQLFFGVHYKGDQTNWDELFKLINIFKDVTDTFTASIFTPQLKQFLLSSKSNFDILKSGVTIFDSLSTNRIDSRLAFTFNNIGNNTPIKHIRCVFEILLKQVDNLQSHYLGFTKLSHRRTDYGSVMSDLYTLARLQTIGIEANEQKTELSTDFNYLYEGMETNWDTIIKTLSFASDFNKFVIAYKLPNSFVKNICEDDKTITLARTTALIISDKYDELIKEFKWFCTLFDESEKFDDYNLYRLIGKVEKCANSIVLLEEWIDFRSNRKNCIDNGLQSYIENIEQTKINAGLITDTFLKRFYRLWLDATIPNYPAINSFRRKSFEDTINEFKLLDTNQLIIARSRVRERLISNLPNLTIATASRDELGILKRELHKQRKLLPLRKLFNAIPNLLTSLKPCLMMSPLSVSVFLEADSYNFDLVIFDEASQVRTEDAIGAVMRGKQVIIVGDNKQLPPTNFFATATSSEDFDNEEDDEIDDTGAYESILDEALKSIPERSLRWHYRSRHEHLIAFSNAKIYNYDLITFPSNIDKAQDNGVEYIHVANGVYDRGGKRNNINEAMRIAELVFEHIRKQPNRSLGIVTFSEAQQLAVDGTINQLRLTNPQYEYFFSEEKEEAFFIKNLENVQGDERDTIIFSIGYAKDASGVMYMNFGPLGKPGGHRRLNVAITRAKYNIKLVGSIQPSDINIEKTNSEGVKLLRAYIDFAINGESTLANELKYSEAVSLESPFEESVYDFLLSKGYNITTQVVCSGFRIDMAVKHPTLNGVFVLGIECDGATYHSSRTARERDRLRQTVLEDIGWKIYRVWSTDWIKDPFNEGEKLCSAIEKAISNFSMATLSSSDKYEINNYLTMYDSTLADKENEIKITEPTNENINYNRYDFIEYKEVDIKEVDRNYDPINYYSHVLKFVIQNEYPIHFENLCKRVAPLFGNQKATQKVTESVHRLLNGHLQNEIVKDGDFLSPKNVTTIFVRVPMENSNYTRPIHYISYIELAEAMLCVAKKSYGIKSEDLFVKTAREFGFNRTGTNITQAFQAAYVYLKEKGKVKEVDGNKVIII